MGDRMDRPIGVLIVDDQAPFRRAARAVVERTKGFEVSGEAESGEEAVELVRQLAPDPGPVEKQPPGINGIEPARRINDDGGGTVVILLSPYQVNALPADALESGA